MYNYLESIEKLSCSTNLHKGEITDFTREVLIIATKTLNCQSSNIWLFDENQTKLTSLLSYMRSDNSFVNQQILDITQLPIYFKSLKKNKIIISNNTANDPIMAELLKSYLIPNKITSMIDVPLRSEGKMIGVICFEYREVQHDWTIDEQRFTQSLAQLLSLALETEKKREYRIALEKIITQKELLISEVNHRVKNNMAVIISLINSQKQKAKDTHNSELFEEIKNKVYSMSMIQDQLNSNSNIESIDLGTFLESLVANLNSSYGLEKRIEINLEMEKVGIKISIAIPCGLIANEILTNSFKYAFGDQNKFPSLKITLKQTGEFVQLSFHDNGPGFDLKAVNTGMGMELIKDLSEQIDAKMSINIDNGVEVQLQFPIL